MQKLHLIRVKHCRAKYASGTAVHDFLLRMLRDSQVQRVDTSWYPLDVLRETLQV